MITSFWQELTSNSFSRWVATSLTPALVFWATVLATLIWRDGWHEWEVWIEKLSSISLYAISVVSILTPLISTFIMQAVEEPILRFLAGYSWPNWLRIVAKPIVKRYRNQLRKAEAQWQQLYERIYPLFAPEGSNYFQQLSEDEQERLICLKREFIELDKALHYIPSQEVDWMPTRFGNLLRAAELKPKERYGLDVIICWSRLWLILPETARNDLMAARLALNLTVQLWIWTILLAGWMLYLWFWWLAFDAFLATALVYYVGILRTARLYGELIEAVFDLYRFDLYRSLHWSVPTKAEDEAQYGERLTQYLWRGVTDPMPTYSETAIQQLV